jgi:hypothetical protein
LTILTSIAKGLEQESADVDHLWHETEALERGLEGIVERATIPLDG